MAIKHSLELNSHSFPTFRDLPDLPPGVYGSDTEGWHLICEIVNNESFWRPMYRMRDKDGETFLLAFYLDNSANPATVQKLKSYKPGDMMCIENALSHQFMDGQEGVRLEDEELDDVTVR